MPSSFTFVTTVLGISGKYLDTDGDLVPDYIESRDGTDVNATVSESYYARWGFTPSIYHENLYNRPYLNVAFTFVL